MASIYRRENSRVWQCAFYVPTEDGTQKVRKSTSKTKRREAERVAVELERSARESAGVSDTKARKIHVILAEAGEDALKERLTVFKARAHLATGSLRRRPMRNSRRSL